MRDITGRTPTVALHMTELICRRLTRKGTYLSSAGEEQVAVPG
jgi:hypothetical protein